MAGVPDDALTAIYRGIRSRIYMSEGVDNEGRSFGADVRYYPCYLQVGSEWRPALLTRDQLEKATERAQDNPEDMPPMAAWWQLWMERL